MKQKYIIVQMISNKFASTLRLICEIVHIRVLRNRMKQYYDNEFLKLIALNY